jgi:hypothetical protein
VRFASEFDPQAFHLDEAAARRTLFGGLVASGWHTAAMAMRMMCDGYLHRAAGLGSPGIENLKWLLPVRPGDTLRVRLTVLGARPLKSKPGVGFVKSRHEVLNSATRWSWRWRRGMFGAAGHARLLPGRRSGRAGPASDLAGSRMAPKVAVPMPPIVKAPNLSV